MTQVSPPDAVRPIAWRDDALVLLDQRVLPQEEKDVVCRTAGEAAAAIRDMVVRGAPAIGITAAWGVVLAVQEHGNAPDLQAKLAADMARLRESRPTAVNLFWALDRMQLRLNQLVTEGADAAQRCASMLAEAQAIHEDDIAINRRMGVLGADYIGKGESVLTHCNAGALATGGYGTALGVIRSAWAADRLAGVYADETRPWLQGARLTAWELLRDGIPTTLIVEGAAASLMAQGQVQWVIVGADRVAANGDVANKIGTYGLAVLARQHGVRFMVVAPTSTVDLDCPEGAAIPIETRAAEEVTRLGDRPVAAPGAGAWNPVFDVTPAALVDVLVTERGVLERPDRDSLLALMESA